MTDTPILARFTAAVAEALAPLDDAFDSPDGMAQFLATIGWPVLAEELTGVNAAFGPVPAAVTALGQAAAALASGNSDPATQVPAVADAIQAVTTAIGALTTPGNVAGLPQLMQSPAFWTSFATDVVDHLIYHYLQREVPMLFAPLRAAGVLRSEPATDGRTGDRKVVDWTELGRLFSDPVGALQNRYGWHGSFHSEELLIALAEALASLGQSTDLRSPTTAFDAQYWGGQRGPDRLIWTLWQALVVTGDSMAASRLGLVVAPIPASGQSGGPPAGLVLTPELLGRIGTSQQLSETVTLQLTGSLDTGQALQAVLRPTGMQFVVGPGGQASLDVAVTAKPPKPWQLLGGAGTSRVEVPEAHAGIGIASTAAGALQLSLRAGATGAVLVLEPGDLDSFLGQLLGGKTQRIPLSPTVTWSNTGGFSFNGGSGLSLDIPLGLSLADIVRVDSMHLELAGSQSAGASLHLTLSATLSLGPIVAHVDGVGVSVQLEPGVGNAGHAKVKLGFQPPRGMGLSLNAGLVSGGGVLSFDPDHGKYVGAIALSVEAIAVTAVGVLTTRNPDGSPILDRAGKPTFSLLILISATFPPIQLGFGFSLTGIGGLVGLNRGIEVEALRGGVRSGALESVLFPRDVVRNAESLVGQLNTLFPPSAGGLLLGPMVRLSWGEPVLLNLDLAVLLEIGASSLVAVVLGRLRIGLPTDSPVAVVRINLDAAGVVNFSTGEVSLDAALYDSMIAGFVLTGQLALRARWRGEPSFALAIGGFHPAFSPPPGFPALERMSIALASGDNPMLRLSCYLAVTSNTVQFGALLELYAAEGPANVRGHLGFDALITLSPFGFAVDIYGSVALRWKNKQIAAVDVTVHLTGPRPWHAWGSASVSILIATVTVKFDLRIGSSAPAPLPAPVKVADRVAAAIRSAANWSITPPAGESVVLFSSASLPDGLAAAHPLGGFRFTQSVVPFGVTITNYGAAKVTGPAYFAIAKVRVNGVDADFGPLSGEFAPAQFFRLDDAAKLSRPSFELHPAGAAIGLSGAGYDVLASTDPADFSYQIITISGGTQTPPVISPPPPPPSDGLPESLAGDAEPVRSLSTRPLPSPSPTPDPSPAPSPSPEPIPSPAPSPRPVPWPKPVPDPPPVVTRKFDAELAARLSHSGPVARSAAARTSARRFAEPGLSLALLDGPGGDQ